MVMGELTQETELLVIGGGPGGYAAAFRAADLGLEVTLVDRAGALGGECLFRGCIPSKSLLHIAELIYDIQQAGHMGLSMAPPKIELSVLQKWKNQVTGELADGLTYQCKQRGIQLIQGRAVIESSQRARIYEADIAHIRFKHAVIATGSATRAILGKAFSPESRIMDSSAALALQEIPGSLLVIGGGYVGLELGMVYAALGGKVTLVENAVEILSGVDRDLVAPLVRRLKTTFEEMMFETTITGLEETETGVIATLKTPKAERTLEVDRVLVAVGRVPRTEGIGLETTKIRLDSRGFIRVDGQQRTDDPRIFAVGDVTGGMMLAHKASREGKVAAEVIAGKPSAFDARAIPAVVYTDPQIAWCGLTETAAKESGIAIRVEKFPWKASGRAFTMDARDGLTKLVLEPVSGRILGVGVVGRHAEDLIAEGVLAVEMGALAEDLALSIHPHPTLSETEAEAAALFVERTKQ
jgi:dihydrolipoamide dehydrogenase